MRLLILTALAFGALTACGRDIHLASRQMNGTCAPSPYVASAAGASCTSAQNCTEFCCTCSNVSKQYSVQGCVDLECGSFQELCEEALARDPSLCEA